MSQLKYFFFYKKKVKKEKITDRKLEQFKEKK